MTYVRVLLATGNPCVVCRLFVSNIRSPESAGRNFQQLYYAIFTLAIRWTSLKMSRRLFQELLCQRQGLNASGIAKYSEVGPVEG